MEPGNGPLPQVPASIRRRPTFKTLCCSARPMAGSTACGPVTGNWSGSSWRHPNSGWIGVSSQLESPWPVHGSLLVLDGIVYFAAGRSSELDGGIFMYALDAGNGRLVHQRQLQGPAYTSENIETNFQLPMGALTDVMMSDGDNIYMRSLAFDLQLNRRKGKPNLETWERPIG